MRRLCISFAILTVAVNSWSTQCPGKTISLVKTEITASEPLLISAPSPQLAERMQRWQFSIRDTHGKRRRVKAIAIAKDVRVLRIAAPFIKPGGKYHLLIRGFATRNICSYKSKQGCYYRVVNDQPFNVLSESVEAEAANTAKWEIKSVGLSSGFMGYTSELDIQSTNKTADLAHVPILARLEEIGNADAKLTLYQIAYPSRLPNQGNFRVKFGHQNICASDFMMIYATRYALTIYGLSHGEPHPLAAWQFTVPKPSGLSDADMALIKEHYSFPADVKPTDQLWMRYTQIQNDHGLWQRFKDATRQPTTCLQTDLQLKALAKMEIPALK